MIPKSRPSHLFLFLFLSLASFAGPLTLCPAESYTLPDSGQTKCYDRSTEIPCPKPGEPFYGQDGHYQVPELAYELSQDGLAVTDLNTGLAWQQADDGVKRDWFKADAYCENLDLGGHSDWRLPTRMELVSLVDYGRYNPAIHPVLRAQKDDYWSSSIHAVHLGRAWHVSFGSGYVGFRDKSWNRYVRCVRGEQLPSGSITDNNDGTLTDSATGFTWQQTDDGSPQRWEGALSYCDGLDLAGHTDWRLPNIRELQSIVDDGLNGPAIDSVFSSRSDRYWSGSTDVARATDGWHVDFGQGAAAADYKSGSAGLVSVRCVRGGKMPLPQSQHVFVVAAVAGPVLSVDPAQAIPVGVGEVATSGSIVGPVADEGSTVSLHVSLEAFSGPVDIYLGVYMPDVDPVNILILRSNNRFQSHLDGVVPWKENTTGPVDERLFGDISTSLLPAGTYEIYLGVTATGQDFSGPFYLWKTGFEVAQ